MVAPCRTPWSPAARQCCAGAPTRCCFSRVLSSSALPLHRRPGGHVTLWRRREHGGAGNWLLLHSCSRHWQLLTRQENFHFPELKKKCSEYWSSFIGQAALNLGTLVFTHHAGTWRLAAVDDWCRLASLGFCTVINDHRDQKYSTIARYSRHRSPTLTVPVPTKYFFPDSPLIFSRFLWPKLHMSDSYWYFMLKILDYNQYLFVFFSICR